MTLFSSFILRGGLLGASYPLAIRAENVCIACSVGTVGHQDTLPTEFDVEPTDITEAELPSTTITASRYQRRSGSLPRLTDQPDANFSLSLLPRPLPAPSGPIEVLRSLLAI